MNLQQIINSMNVPEMRKDLSKPTNVRWLRRNLQVQNREHPQIKKVLAALAGRKDFAVEPVASLKVVK